MDGINITPTQALTGADLRVNQSNSPYIDHRQMLEIKGEGGARVLRTQDFQYEVIKKVGEGATSKVFATNRQHIREREAPVVKVLKFSETRFTPQKNRLNLISPNSKRGRNLDHLGPIYHLGNKSVCEVEPKVGDLTGIDHALGLNPVTRVVRYVSDVLNGLGSLHRQNLLHRDIKGPNILISKDGCACLTDFGLLRDVREEEHSTTTTLLYAAPYIWKDKEAQLNRRGIQTKGADIYALGQTIQYDIIRPILKQYIEAQDSNVKLRWRELRPIHLKGDNMVKYKATTEQLAEQYPERVIYSSARDQENDTTYVESVYLLPDRGVQLKSTLECIDYLRKAEREPLTSRELDKMEGLARLVHDLLAPTRPALCEALGVKPEEENSGDLLVQAASKRLTEILGRDAQQGLKFEASRSPEQKRVKFDSGEK